MTKTHTMRSRLISLVLVLVMVLGCLPLSALALNDQNRLNFATNDPVTLTLPTEAVAGETYDVDFSVKLKVNASNFTGSPFGNGTFTYDLYLSLESGNANANIQGGARTLAATLNVDTGAKTIDVLGAGAYGVTSQVMHDTNTTLITIAGTVQYTPKNLENDGSVKATAYLYNGTALDEYETETVNIGKPGEVSSDVTITVKDDTNDHATVAFTPGVTTGTTTATAGSQVQFTVTPDTDYKVADVYATYNNGTILTVNQAGGKYYFTVPSVDQFTGDKEVTLYVSTVSTAKTATTVEVETDVEKVLPGSTVQATATVKNVGTDAAITDTVGSIVLFTWPDNTMTYGFVDATGEAVSSWTPTDAFAATLVEDTRDDKGVSVAYGGNEVYAASNGTSKPITVGSRTIEAAPGAAIVATPEGSSQGIQSGLTAMETYTLSLTPDYPIVNSQGIKLQETAHAEGGEDYTVTWYENNGSGVWNKITELTVTPKNTRTQYKAVFTPKGDYTLGEVVLVIGCDKAAETEVTNARSNTTNVSPVVEGKPIRLAASVKYNNSTDGVSGGEVIFRTANDNGAYANLELARAAVNNGEAKLEVTTSLPAGQYQVIAYYTGVDGVFEASTSDPFTIYVKSATLVTDGWSIKINANGNDPTNLQLGVENTLSISVPAGNGYTGDDYRVEWLVSKDGGETWALAGTEDTLKVTPANKLYQYYAIVYPDGDYVAPTGGISVAKVTAADDAVVTTSMTLTATPSPAFDGETIVLRAKVVDGKDVPVTAGTVTFTDGNGFSYEAPVGMGGFAECTILGGISADTIFTATYADASGIYGDCRQTVAVEVKSREIRLSANTANAAITVKGDMEVGNTVELTAPLVYAKDATRADQYLTVGKDFYYQWQYSTDYKPGNGTDYTATWINFSAPTVGDDGRTIRVTIGDANTAFRVVAMPYGNYMYPATGVVTEAVCGNSDKMTTSVDVQVRSVENLATIYEGDEIVITAKVESNGKAVDEGYVAFMIQKNGANLTIGTAEVASNGVATLNYTAYADRMDKVVVNYLGTDKYKASWNNEADVTIKSVKIKVTQNIQGAFTQVSIPATITAPVVTDLEDNILTIGTDYYVQWQVSTGDGWQDYEKQVTGTEITFTPATEDVQLSAVVYPIGKYSEPSEGIAAGVVSNAKLLQTTTTLDVDSSWYEGDTVTLTATVKYGVHQRIVRDGIVEFYVQGDGMESHFIGSSTLNKNGEAILEYTLPIYTGGAGLRFYAQYMGTDVYDTSVVHYGNTYYPIKSATITFADDAAIAISDADGNTVAADKVQVGVTYTLTAPEVYEVGNLTTALECGKDYYYIWQYSADGSTWETVQSDVTAAGNVLNNAVFGNENAEYRAIAYPMGGSGSIYRYPANGIVVATSLNPTLRETTTTLEVSNYYAQTGTAPIFPVGRNITLTATVLDGTAPAYGVVTFSYEVNGTSTTIGSVHLDPGGVATITVPAPATVNNDYSFKATYDGNTVFEASNDSARVVVLSNAIELNDKLTINDANGEVKEPVVGTAYTLKGVTANVENANSYQTSAKAVNEEHAKGVNPYYTYVWQKSEDGGVTWYNLDNAANSNVLKDVVFETDQTQYRLAAYPVASSGWIAPAAGVFSDPVSVKTQDTEVTITMKDEAGVAIAKKANRFENTEVNVTVNVSGVADYVEGSKGYVQLEVVRYHNDGVGNASTRKTVYTTTGEVDNSGNVTFKVNLPAYSYNPGELSNQVNFVATYSGDDHFTGSELDVGQAYVNLKSAAITWPQDAEDHDAFVKDITIYEGTDTSETGTTTNTMVANQTYTLKLPTIYSGDVYSSSGTRKDVALTVNEDYTVVWQYRPMGETTNEWRALDAASADTCVVICNEGRENYSYRAVVTPMGDYTFAMDLVFGTLTSSNKLTSKPTADTVLADTTTDLSITGTVAEANDVKIYNGTPFADLDGTEHYTQYEGETVTLKAKVKDADGNLVDTGHVYFYRVEETENSQTHVRLNTEYVEVKNGFAEYTVTIRDFNEDLATIANVDKFYAVYEANDTYNTSTSTTTDDSTGTIVYQAPTEVADMIYIRSTAIATPRLTSTENGSRDGYDNKKTTTWTSDLTNLPAAVKISFSLMRTAGNETEGYSVVGTDGRWLTNGTDYTIQWYREDKTVDEGGEETGSLKAIDGATQVTYAKAAAENYQKYCVKVIAAGHMKTGAMSMKAIIGKTADPVLDLNPGYTFEPTDADVQTGVTATPGAHYGDEVTLTATVKGDATTNALPTGTVTFYYRTSDGAWTALSEAINLEQKDVSENKLVAVATYTFNSSVLPFNVDRIGYSYSGDDYYSAYSAEAMQKSATGAEYAKLAFKLWSVQISNPAHEAGEVKPADKNYTEADCYPDGKSYGDVTIKIYNFDENRSGFKGAEFTGTELVANTKYTLEVQDIYTKNGEKLDLAHDNSADYTIEWFKSTDGGLTWGPLPETEYTNIDAKTIAVTPLTKDYKYMVKVTTTNSFYNEKMPSLVDFEYSEKNVNTILQNVTVVVDAIAEMPVNGVDEWVYQSNPITLFATVTPTNNGEPSGHVEFYYGFAKEGSAEGDYSEVEWTAVKSDTESGTNVAELVKTTSGTDTDGVMVAKLTTSNLPVTTDDGTYSQLVIKAVYTGDQTYAAQDNIKSNVSISSPVVTVFSSKILQDVKNISNEVLTFNGENWTNAETDASGDLYDGVIITGKTLTSDGTKTVITLNPVYTLDVIDREDAIFTDLSSIYTLTAGVDYTVEWQYCENYTAYKEYLDDPATNDKNWMIVDNASVSSDFCTVEQVQGYAYRAVITPCDTAKAQRSFQDNDKIYSNILVVGDAEARVLTNIRKASSASVKGDPVYIDAIIMGGTTTPVGSVTVTVKDRFGNEAFKADQDIANGWTTFVWENVQAGEYTITTELTGNNGYVGDANVQNYIVRFTDEVNGGDLDMSIPDVTVTYDGQVQMLDSSKVTINGFGKYTDWYEMAKESVVFQYFDKDGNRVAEPVDAGTYTVKAYLPETMYWGYVKAADATLTIEKRPVTITDVTAQAKTYDGTNNVYVQNVELELSELDAAGLPTGDDGLVEGDSVYVNAEATVWNADAGERTLTLTSAVLVGPDDNNYEIDNPTYSEKFVVSRNQLYGDAVTSITAAPGYKITDDDFYMIDQAGNRITADEATITYVYHGGNVGAAEKENSTEYEGVYTVMIGMPENNYQSGLTTLLYIKEGATTTREGLPLDMSATSALAYITNTNHVYDGTPKSVTVTTTKGTAKVEYAGDGVYSETAPTNAGRYMVKVTVEDQTYYGVMTIVKGEPQFSFSATSVTYDGDRYDVADLKLSETTKYGVLNDSVSKYGALYYTYVGGSIVGYDYNAPRDVSYTEANYVDSETSGAYGAYMVTAHVPETANTIAVTPSATFEIKKANLTVTGDEIYTRRFDTHSKLTSTYKGFVGDKYGNDSELRDLIALPTFKLGDNDILSNIDMTTVGNLTIYLSDVNARNYKITYEHGRATTNALPTQDALEIRNIPSTIYFRDTFQLFLYGSRGELVSGNGTATCEASKVTWSSSAPSIATVDDEGNVNIIGVGNFTITAVRGDDPDTKIKTSVDLTAKALRNDVVIARDDYLYDGTAKYVDKDNFDYYYMQHGTRFESKDPLSKDHCTTTGEPQTISGEYPVTAKITEATKNCGDGAGLLAIHRVNSTVTPNGDSATYGQSIFAGKGYDADPTAGGEKTEDVLKNGRVAADVRSNSDADHYEILVAGGTEGWNYNVTYAPYAYSTSSNHDYDINQATVDFTVGSLEDTVGMTENWRTKTGTLLGDAVDPNALFQNEDIRTFGEQNQVLAYVIGDGLVTGDSFIDLFDIDRANTVFAKLNAEYKFSVEGAANEKYQNGGAITEEHGTLDHQLIVPDPVIDEADYVISGYTKSRNYKVTINNGRLDVEQRKVGVADDTVVMLPAGTDPEDIIDIIGPQIEFTGLADKLDHDYRDLLLSIDGKVVTDPGTTAKEYTLVCGNTNYYMDPAHNKITIVIGEVRAYGDFWIKTPEYTIVRITRVIGEDETPASGIADLDLSVYNAADDKLLVTGRMAEIEPEAGWDTKYAYYRLDHSSLYGYSDIYYRLKATGYNFTYPDEN